MEKCPPCKTGTRLVCILQAATKLALFSSAVSAEKVSDIGRKNAHKINEKCLQAELSGMRPQKRKSNP